jgi:hypothetical protein
VNLRNGPGPVASSQSAVNVFYLNATLKEALIGFKSHAVPSILHDYEVQGALDSFGFRLRSQGPLGLLDFCRIQLEVLVGSLPRHVYSYN